MIVWRIGEKIISELFYAVLCTIRGLIHSHYYMACHRRSQGVQWTQVHPQGEKYNFWP